MYDISIVVPVYNEQDNLELLNSQIHDVLDGMNQSYECIYVDDGSVDNSPKILQRLSSIHPQNKAILLRKNFGQTAALTAGFDKALGEIVVTMDADLQNDPKDIPQMVARIREGYDLVSGWRKDRKDSWIRNLPSHLANSMISHVTGVKIHDSGCTLKAYRREILDGLHLYGEMHRFIPALASSIGIKLTEMPVRHHPRKYGVSKYGLSRTFRVLFDLVTVKFLLSYAASPIQMFGKCGLGASLFGIATLVLAVILKFTHGKTLTGNPLFYVFIFTQLVAVQFLLIGLLAEMNTRIYHEFQKKKTYVVREECEHN